MPTPAATVMSDQAPERRDADQHRAGGAGEADMRQRMTGEGLAAQHQEVADQAADDRDDGRRREGVPHEIVVEHDACAVGSCVAVASRSTSWPPDMTKIRPFEAHHVDLGSVEPRQHRAGDHLVDRAERRLAAPR